MSKDTHDLELLSAYALGCLDEAEDRLVSEHLAGCHICRTELQSFQMVTDQLALAVPDVEPPDQLKRRLLERVESLHPVRPRPQPEPKSFLQRLQPFKAAFSLVVIIALIITNLFLWQRVNQLGVLAGQQGMRAVALHSSDLTPQASGFVIISADGENGVLVVDQMPHLNPERTYQLWLIHDERSTSGAIFSVDEDGYRGVRIMAPESLLVYSAIRITIEPAGGSATPTGEQVLGGSLFNY
jgi:anti-sigma-K factor RskA